jgi:hypothetical protein
MRIILVSALLSFAVGACGSSGPLDPGSGDSAGSGTATLVVDGNASAHPSVANATQPSDFSTDFSVRITLNNVAITTGTVTMTSSSGDVPLTFRANANNGGHWEATGAGYDEVYQLDVVSGADAVHGVRVDGPGIHTFSAPMAGASVDSTVALPLAWNRSSTADAAVLRVSDGGDGVTIADTGNYMMAPASLKSSKDHAQPNTIQLTRTNRVTPAGAAGGSELSVSIENTIDVVAQINPNAP